MHNSGSTVVDEAFQVGAIELLATCLLRFKTLERNPFPLDVSDLDKIKTNRYSVLNGSLHEKTRVSCKTNHVLQKFEWTKSCMTIKSLTTQKRLIRFSDFKLQ